MGQARSGRHDPGLGCNHLEDGGLVRGATCLHLQRQAVERIQADLRDFKAREKLDQVVMVNVSSTEPPVTPDKRLDSVAAFQSILDDKQSNLPASALYAWAALDMGFPLVNFTPSLGASFPAALELAKERKAPMCGKDGKTGETMMKSVLAPMFAHRNLRILSWVGHNIFGQPRRHRA